jgi:hypothetical protein
MYYYQKCCSCETVFTNKVEIDTCPICRGKNFIRKLDPPKPKKPKIKIESIQVFAHNDESPDTSTLGEYTNKASDWAIDRASGEYCYKIWQRQRIIDALHEKLDDHQDETDTPEYAALLKKTKNRIKNIRESGPCETGEMRREYSFFIPYAGGEKRGSKEYKEYGMHDYKRMEALNNGHWSYIGIIAKAKILVPIVGNPGSSQYQTISSGGLWGIESDSGKDFFEETIDDELSGLADQLEALGLGKRQIEYAIRKCDKELIWK